jgi:hypothetical protein
LIRGEEPMSDFGTLGPAPSQETDESRHRVSPKQAVPLYIEKKTEIHRGEEILCNILLITFISIHFNHYLNTKENM